MFIHLGYLRIYFFFYPKLFSSFLQLTAKLFTRVLYMLSHSDRHSNEGCHNNLADDGTRLSAVNGRCASCGLYEVCIAFRTTRLRCLVRLLVRRWQSVTVKVTIRIIGSV